MNLLPTGPRFPQVDKPHIELTSPSPPVGNLPVLASLFSSLLGWKQIYIFNSSLALILITSQSPNPMTHLLTRYWSYWTCKTLLLLTDLGSHHFLFLSKCIFKISQSSICCGYYVVPFPPWNLFDVLSISLKYHSTFYVSYSLSTLYYDYFYTYLLLTTWSLRANRTRYFSSLYYAKVFCL